MFLIQRENTVDLPDAPAGVVAATPEQRITQGRLPEPLLASTAQVLPGQAGL